MLRRKKILLRILDENNGRVRGIHKRGKCLIFQIFQSPALLKMSHKMLKFYGGVDFFAETLPIILKITWDKMVIIHVIILVARGAFSF